MGIINKLYDFHAVPSKSVQFAIDEEAWKNFFHDAILVYAGSLPQASPDCQRPLALLANSMFVTKLLSYGGQL